ncbi:MAG: DNA topoisomerase IB [Actinomycetota bacterium]|nr:DNA topoisomerase IB [Actinomycetota bacterium]
MRLKRAAPSGPGWERRRHGKGFVYVDATGSRLATTDIVRCKDLVIPPAWEDVWICQYANGHIQAIGVDAAGRKQYLYHPEWRRQRDEAKFDHVLTVAKRLPKARERVARDLKAKGMPRRRALALAFRLLDLGFFRIGGEEYAEENESYGLATIRKDHVTVTGDRVEIAYVAKGGKEQLTALADPDVLKTVRELRQRRGGTDELLAYKDNGRWHDVESAEINEHLKELVGGSITAKDFRTWHGTVLAAVALAVSSRASDSPTARKRAVARAMSEVADYLGNTPAVVRSAYVDPRVVDLFEDGITIERSLRRLGEDTDPGHPATHGAIERAVVRMLTQHRST